MADQTARERTLVKYLNEAYGKEKQLETTLQAQIKLADKTLKKRLQDHLKETKAQARGLEKRMKQLNGKADASNLPGPDAVANAAQSLTNKAMAAAKGPVQALRGTSPADNLLRNVRDAFWNEAEEIAHYSLIENLAEQLGDKETVKLAKEFRRQEERMQKFLEGQIKQLVKAVIKEEVPASERKPAASSSSSRGTRSRSSSSGSSGTSRSASRSSGTASRSRSASSGTKASGTRSSGAKSSRAKSAGTRSTAAKSSGTKSSGTKSRSASTRSKSTGSSRSRSGGSSGSSGSSGS